MMRMIDEDTIEEILLRLPVKSLVCFKSVCKKWLRLIESSDFIKSHLKLGRHNHILLKFNDGVNSNENAISCYDNYESIESPPPYYFRVHGFNYRECPKISRLMNFASCTHSNGIVCLIDCISIDPAPVTLFNPALREFKSLPPCPFRPFRCPYDEWGCEDCCILVGYGFGFDAAINNFKVVRMMYRVDYLRPGPPCQEYYIEAQVYDLNTNCWRRSGRIYNIFPGSLLMITPPVLFNGILHYICCRINDPKHLRVILSFNISTELFVIMEFPVHWKDCYVETDMESSIFMADESTLASVTFTYPVQPLPPLDLDFTCVLLDACVQLDVWLMKEYGVRESWTKQYSIMSPDSSRVGRPLSFVKKDKLLFITAHGKLICYDLPTGQQHQLRQYQFRQYERLEDVIYHRVLDSFGVVICNESLVSFKNLSIDFDIHEYQ